MAEEGNVVKRVERKRPKTSQVKRIYEEEEEKKEEQSDEL